MTVDVHGSVTPGFEAVKTAFQRAVDGDPAMGGALAVRHRGLPVVDLWAGTTDALGTAPWREDTLSVIFSCTKGLMSLLAARLVLDGQLSYDAPVADYWPAFAAAGKSTVRVRDLLSHRAGLSAPRVPLTPDDLLDWDTVSAQLAAQEPLWEPGTGYAYHAITHGWLIGEVIRRVTGAGVGAVFQELVARPLDAAAWIGLPPTEHGRVATMLVGDSLAELTRIQASGRTSGVVDWSEQAMTLGGALPHELVGPDAGFNRPEVQAAEIPGAGGIATARALATIWSAAFRETQGVRLLDERTIDAATVPQSSGPPVWDIPGPWPAWGMGFQLDSEARRYLSSRSFGHDGAGGQVAFADPTHDIGFAFLTNRMEGIGDVRGTAIVDALRETLAGIDGHPS